MPRADSTTRGVVLSHPTGNENVRHAAHGFARAHLLDRFYTCLDVPDFVRSLPGPIARRAAERRLPDSLQGRVRTQPARELLRLTALSLGHRPKVGSPLSVDSVYKALDERVARAVTRERAGAVYCYEDGARATLEAAAEVQATRVYELPSGHWRAHHDVSETERASQPDYAATLTALRDPGWKLRRKDEELALAELVVVASTYAAEGVRPYLSAAQRLAVVPYGAVPPQANTLPRAAGPLRALYVGRMSQLKGLSYLLDACDTRTPHVELTLIGSRPTSCDAMDRRLARHTYLGPLPRSDVLAHMNRADVLVFPSLHEGFGLVILEALSQGLPVLTTRNTGGPDVLREGEDGWVVPTRSSEAIGEVLDRLLEAPTTWDDHRDAARQAARRASWARYELTLAGAVAEAMGRA